MHVVWFSCLVLIITGHMTLKTHFLMDRLEYVYFICRRYEIKDIPCDTEEECAVWLRNIYKQKVSLTLKNTEIVIIQSLK